MGNLLCTASSDELGYNNLQERIHRLEEAADLNNDGLVTKEELQVYTANQLELKDSEIMVLRTEKARLMNDLAELARVKDKLVDTARAEAVKWKDAHDRLQRVLAQDLREASAERDTVISNQAIERFVEELLNDPNINIRVLPDGIERPLYANFLKITLSILQKLFNNSNIDLIGHEFKVQVQPTLETQLMDTADNNEQ